MGLGFRGMGSRDYSWGYVGTRTSIHTPISYVVPDSFSVLPQIWATLFSHLSKLFFVGIVSRFFFFKKIVGIRKRNPDIS